MLTGGKVLIAGGATDTAELYDPVTNQFSATGNTMTAPRFHHTSTLLKDGQVLLAGGAPYQAGPALQSAELYDPVSNSFVPVAAPMQSPRVRQVAALLPNGNVLLAGGSTGQDTFLGATDTAETYDPVNKTFTFTTHNMSSQRYAATGTVLSDGSILIVDGANTSTVVASADIFSPPTRRFYPTVGSPIVPRSGHSAVLLADGTVLVMGGGRTSSIVASAEIYNPMTGTFMLGPSMAYARWLFTATRLLDGSVLIAVGVYNTTLSSTELFTQ